MPGLLGGGTRHGTFIAFVGAPVIPALVAAWVVHLNQTYKPATMFVFVCLVFYALQALVGLPAYLVMSRKKLHRWWTYVLLGGAAPTVVLLFLFARQHAEKGYTLANYVILYYPALLGAGSGLMFWLLARPDKPDQVVLPPSY